MIKYKHKTLEQKEILSLKSIHISYSYTCIQISRKNGVQRVINIKYSQYPARLIMYTCAILYMNVYVSIFA